MAAGRSLINRRRRADEDTEEDDGAVMVEDSQSEGSVLTDVDDDEDEGSTLGEVRSASQANGEESTRKPEAPVNGIKATGKARKSRKKSGKTQAGASEHEEGEEPAVFKAAADTEAMMRGLEIADEDDDAVDFEDVGDSVSVAAEKRAQVIATTPAVRIERPAERQRREHEDYKKKRDSDPAFIPNRGNFFMHDTRGANGRGPAPDRGALAGRGRGRGGPQVGGPFSPANQIARAERAHEMPWKHDLHESINEEVPAPASARPSGLTRDQEESARIFPKPGILAPRQSQPAVISFSTTAVLGKVPARVFLPGMKAAITASEPLTVKKYVRLPDHRPPLRRDKPVRAFIPGLGPKYIFPSADRSFIFIPRQLRPNQRGFGNSNYQRSAGGYGYSSRRTSMYGGSVYSASIAPSRRSSIARDRESAFSPVSFASGFPGQGRPVVRLPHGGQMFSNTTSPAGPLSGRHTPTGQFVHTYPLPQKPTFTGTPTATVHQPRPQKTISVTGIESPAALQQARPPTAEQQPFHGQLPAHMVEQAAYGHQTQPSYYSPHQPFTYPNQAPPAGTPLSGIPEHAMHAQNFQPSGIYYQQYPQQQQQQQQGYYYPQQQMPMYMPPAPQQSYMMSQQQQQPHSQLQVPEQQASQPTEQQQAPSGMVAHESNGMVFYIPASEAQQQQPSQAQQYQPAESFVPSYAMPGLPPPTPAPEAQYYYPPMAMSQGMYYQQQ